MTAAEANVVTSQVRLAQTDTLKVYVNVPQTRMAFVRPRRTAQIVVRDV